MGGYDQSVILAQTIGGPGYRYICISRPGYLGTPLDTGRSPAAQGDAIAALLDTLGIDRAGVMAISGGGPSAIHFAARHPGRCRGLVLVSTISRRYHMKVPLGFRIMMSLARWPWVAAWMQKSAGRDLRSAAARAVHDPAILARTIGDAETWPLFCAVMTSTFDRLNLRLDGTKNDIGFSSTGDFPLEEVRVPVLVVHGTDDQLVPFELHAREFERRLHGAELLAVEGGEHASIFTHRQLVREKVGAFEEAHFRA